MLGPELVEASRVALAVRQQIQGDRLFEYHTKLLETRGPVNGARALAVAREMGLDVERLKTKMDSPEVRAAVQENVGLGDKLGLSGTPAFVVGNSVVSGAVGRIPAPSDFQRTPVWQGNVLSGRSSQSYPTRTVAKSRSDARQLWSRPRVSSVQPVENVSRRAAFG